MTVYSSVLDDAEDAVAWAMTPCEGIVNRTYWSRLTEDACRAAAETPSDYPILLRCRGVKATTWPCLSRLLIMAEPTLARRIHPAYLKDLDGQDGVARMQRWFRLITGRKPAARSWKHALELVEEDTAK